MVKFTVLNLWKNWGNMIFKCGKNHQKGKNVDFFQEKVGNPGSDCLGLAIGEYVIIQRERGSLGDIMTG